MKRFLGLMRRAAQAFAAIAVLGIVAGCGDDENPVGNGDTECDHVDGEGVQVRSGGETLAWYFGDMTPEGEIEVEHEGMIEIDVFFYDVDSVAFQPPEECDDFSLGYELGSTGVVSVETVDGEPWSLKITGLEEGMTTIQLNIVHGGHNDFTSFPFEVHVEEEGHHEDEPDGVALEADGETIAVAFAGSANGEIEVAHEETTTVISAVFLDEDSVAIDPAELEEGASLVLETADSTVAVAIPDPTEPWKFRVVGIEEGMTELVIKIFHEGHTDFESPPFEVHVEEEGHEEGAPDGVLLDAGGSEVIRVEEGVVTGALDAIAVGDTSDAFTAVFLDEEGNEIPVDSLNEGAELAVESSDTTAAVIRIDGSDPWTFRIIGVGAGSPSITIRILHEGHADYESPALPVSITGSMPEAMSLLDGRNPVATHNYHEDGPGLATGAVFLFPGETRSDLQVALLGEWQVDGGHVAGHRPELALSEKEYSLSWNVEDGSVASITPGSGPWMIDVTGGGEGATTASFTLRRDGVVVYESGDVDLVVASSGSGDTSKSFLLKKNGVRFVVVEDGAIVDSCGNRVPRGYVEGVAGEETTLYSIKYLPRDSDPDDCWIGDDPPSSRLFTFRFADRGVAAVVNHPFHWNEKDVFHIEGITEGETTLRIIALKSDHTVDFISPELPVRITAP